eukprot:COSAG01_NODE_31818_length_590_cov_59.731161_1_plen_79_part_10
MPKRHNDCSSGAYRVLIACLLEFVPRLDKLVVVVQVNAFLDLVARHFLLMSHDLRFLVPVRRFKHAISVSWPSQYRSHV